MKQKLEKDVIIKVKSDGNAIVQGVSVKGKQLVKEYYKIESDQITVQDLGKKNDLLKKILSAELTFSLRASD